MTYVKRFLNIALLLAGIGLGVPGCQTPVSDETAAPVDLAPPSYRADLVELVKLDPTIKLDIRYATPHNFVGKQVYPEARAFLCRPAALALVDAAADLRTLGYGIVVFDGYRPWRITKLFWLMTPPDQKAFVARPSTGSIHNRGYAVDLSLYDLKTGAEVVMPSRFDEMNEKAYPNYSGGTADARKHRDLLMAVMAAHGFTVNECEWWHFNFQGWEKQPVMDIPFSAIRPDR